MKLHKEIRLINSVYHVSISLANEADALTGREKDVFAQFGDISVACGGQFSSEDPDVSFTLPTKTLNFPTQFPLKQLFAIADAADANDRAIVFMTTMIERITEAKDDHLSRNPGMIMDDTVTV